MLVLASVLCVTTQGHRHRGWGTGWARGLQSGWARGRGVVPVPKGCMGKGCAVPVLCQVTEGSHSGPQEDSVSLKYVCLHLAIGTWLDHLTSNLG